MQKKFVVTWIPNGTSVMCSKEFSGMNFVIGALKAINDYGDTLIGVLAVRNVVNDETLE